MRVTTAAMIAGLLCSGSTFGADEWKVIPDDRVQVYLGVMDIDDDIGELQNDVGEPVEVSWDNLPTFGIEVETPYSENREQGLEYGINVGGGFSWKGDGNTFRGTAGGSDGANAIFTIDNSFFLAELHFGGYLRGHLGKFADLYIGGGPALIFASHDLEDEDVEEDDGFGSVSGPVTLDDGTVILSKDSSDDLIFGYYGRAGIEIDVGNNSQMGLGVRYLGGELDFDDTVGEVDLEGIQLLFTYSTWW